MRYPELLIPAIISLASVLFVLPWHLRLRNVATLSMTFWMTTLNVCHIVNAVIWSDKVDNVAPGWCDLSAALQVGYNFGLPLSHFLLARQLENLTSLRARSVLYDEKLAKRGVIVNWLLAVVAPISAILLHLTTQDRRFYILEGVGCVASTYWNAWGLLLMAIVPILIAVAAFAYTVMALVNIQLRRQKVLSMISSDSNTTRSHFIRLFSLAIAEYGTCLLRAVFNTTAFSNGPQPLSHFGEPLPIDLKEVSVLTKAQITDSTWMAQLLQWYTVTACSLVFFACFVTGSETIDFYRNLASRLMPCIADRPGREYSGKLGSGTGSWESRSTKRTNELDSLNSAAHGDKPGMNQLESGIVDPRHEHEAYKMQYPRSPTSPSSDYLVAYSPRSAELAIPLDVDLHKAAPTWSVANNARWPPVPIPRLEIHGPSENSDAEPLRTERMDSVGTTETVGTVDSQDTYARWKGARAMLADRFSPGHR